MATDRSDPDARTEWQGGVFTQAEKSQQILLSMNELTSRKWYPVVVYHLSTRGPMGFSDLEEAIGDVSSRMLSESLKDLESEHGIVDRTVRNDRPLRVEYDLTPRGEEFGSVVRAMVDWGDRHLDDESGPADPED